MQVIRHCATLALVISGGSVSAQELDLRPRSRLGSRATSRHGNSAIPHRPPHYSPPNAPYHEMPFDAPKAGRAGIRDYWATVTADQRNVDFKSQVVAVNGQTGVARWSASLTSAASGARVELDGVFILQVRRPAAFAASCASGGTFVRRKHRRGNKSQRGVRAGGIVPPHL